jgi:PLP dependent protein
MTLIAANLQAVRARIFSICAELGRAPDSVGLLAVSKTWPASSVAEAIGADQRMFGENYVQEALDKIVALASHQLDWHFIGPLQSNKTRSVAENFSWVHSVENLKIAQRLAAQRPEALAPINVCIQVNVSGELSKSGVAPEAALSLARECATLQRLRLRGLMTIPAPTDDKTLQRKQFAILREIKDALNQNGMNLDTLSMGMSHDMEAAIIEGATMVRVGTAIFGERQ